MGMERWGRQIEKALDESCSHEGFRVSTPRIVDGTTSVLIRYLWVTTDHPDLKKGFYVQTNLKPGHLTLQPQLTQLLFEQIASDLSPHNQEKERTLAKEIGTNQDLTDFVECQLWTASNGFVTLKLIPAEPLKARTLIEETPGEFCPN